MFKGSICDFYGIYYLMCFLVINLMTLKVSNNVYLFILQSIICFVFGNHATTLFLYSKAFTFLFLIEVRIS